MNTSIPEMQQSLKKDIISTIMTMTQLTYFESKSITVIKLTAVGANQRNYMLWIT
jgi:hypothetical protein